jgi:CheY-like chemotaxis protein
VFLPAHGDAPRVAPRTREATRPHASGLVLVADDVVFIRSAATRTLEGAGYRVIGAGDGREAIALIDRHGEELVAVLLDVTMPGMSGEEVFHHIQRVRPSLPVVLSSGYSEQDATSRFVGKGLAGFLAKPWMPADLLAAIEKAIAR